MFHKFPDIEQFRHVCKSVRMQTESWQKLPVLEFIGTVKNHGTNAAILFSKGIRYQSREHLIDIDSDNAGFVAYMEQYAHPSHGEIGLPTLISQINQKGLHHETAVGPTWIYGEWCGGNIQKGVALNQLPKMFIIFAIRIGEKWLDMREFSHVELPEFNIFNIMRFKTWTIQIDFSQPELAQNELVKLTEEVGQECPVGKAFGVSGIGEGIVWTHYANDNFMNFKVKDARHSVSKVKKLASVDVEKLASIREFVDYAVTENRLEQGISVLQSEQIDPTDVKNMGAFLRWVATDVFKEETDTLVASGLNPKDVGKYVSDKARKWWFAKYDAS